MSVAFLGLGSNLGDREHYIREALRRLDLEGVKLLKLSTLMETDPVGGPVQGKFLNAVASVETRLAPLDLLDVIHRIELGLGRVRSVPNAPREIDIDILLYDNVVMNTPRLTIPHPRMKERAFVMIPLAQVKDT